MLVGVRRSLAGFNRRSAARGRRSAPPPSAQDEWPACVVRFTPGRLYIGCAAQSTEAVRNPVRGAQFRRDVKLSQKRGKDMAKLGAVIRC